MQTQGTTRRRLFALAVLASCGLNAFADASADKNEAPKPLPPEIVQTWRDAGANVGWMDMNLYLNRHIFAAEDDTGSPREWWDRTSRMPVFQFSEWEEGVLVKLPDPGVPFGLCLNLTKVTDAGLKELAGLKSLQALYLAGTQVTDAGLKELADRKTLQTLDVRGTQVTDAGLKELAGLQSLQRLYLNHCHVMGAGLKELAGLKSLQILNIGGTQVTDAGLKEAAGLKSLQSLIMWGTKATPAGVAELRKDLPKCNIDDQ